MSESLKIDFEYILCLKLKHYTIYYFYILYNIILLEWQQKFR